MSKLKQANLFLRQGRNRDALELFEELRREAPGFRPYENGHKLAKDRLQGERPIVPGCPDVLTQCEATHPASLIRDPEIDHRFMVVTPVINGERFLEHTLSSVLSQAGDFHIDYFVKDAGSRDRTLPILNEVCDGIASGSLPLNCRGIRFRFESRPDAGIYDALAYAFQALPDGNPERDVMCYINADDFFHAAAFATVSRVLDQTPARWVSGQVNVVDEAGETIFSPQFPLGYAQADISAGLHDGKLLYFIQQEGTFWLRTLYSEAGGIDDRWRLAGDFDLWVRFAKHAELLALSCPLASFRQRAGQLSANTDGYYSEIERIRDTEAIPVRGPEPDGNAPRSFLVGKKIPIAGKLQHPGPVCFLSDDGSICEIAYLRRSWINW